MFEFNISVFFSSWDHLVALSLSDTLKRGRDLARARAAEAQVQAVVRERLDFLVVPVVADADYLL